MFGPGFDSLQLHYRIIKPAIAAGFIIIGVLSGVTLVYPFP